MTASEAIEALKKMNLKPTHPFNEARNKAIEALENQIPKKVIKQMCLNCDKTSCPEECENYSDLCPNCGSHLSNDVDFEYPNCPYCTQNLVWSDEE